MHQAADGGVAVAAMHAGQAALVLGPVATFSLWGQHPAGSDPFSENTFQEDVAAMQPLMDWL